MDDRDSWLKRHVNRHRLQFISNLNTDVFIAGFPGLHEMIRNKAFSFYRSCGNSDANTFLIDSIVRIDDFPDLFIGFCEEHDINADLVRIVRTGLQEYEDRQNHLRRRREQHRERTHPPLVPGNGDQDRASPENHSLLGPLRLASNNINENTNGGLVSQEDRDLECTISGLKGADDNVGAKLPDATLETPCPCPYHANVETSSSSSSSDTANMPRGDSELETSSDTTMQIGEHVLPSCTKKIGNLPSESTAPVCDPNIDRRDQDIASTHNHIFLLPLKLTDLCQDQKDNVNQTNLLTASSNRSESKNGGSVSQESMGEITDDIISMENSPYLVNPLKSTINGLKDTEINCLDETEMSCPCPYHTRAEDNNFSENNARRNNVDEKNSRRKYRQELEASSSSSSSDTTIMSRVENEWDTFTTDTNMQSGEPVTFSCTKKIGNLPSESTASVYDPNIDRGDLEQKTSHGDKATFMAEHVASRDVNVSNDTKCIAHEINSARNNGHLKNNTAKHNSTDNQFQERLVSKENTLLENVSTNNKSQNVSNNSQREITRDNESWESFYLSSSDEEELLPNTDIDSLKEFSKWSSDLEKPVQRFHSSEVTGDNFQREGPSETSVVVGDKLQREGPSETSAVVGDKFHREGHSETSTVADDTFHREGHSETSTVAGDKFHREGPSEISTVAGDAYHREVPSETSTVAGDIIHREEPSETSILAGDTFHRDRPSKVKFIVHSPGLSGIECQEDLDHLKASNSRVYDHSNTLVKRVDCEDAREKQKSVTYSNSVTECNISPLSLTESISSETDVKEVNEITTAVPQQQTCEEKQIQYDSDDFHSLHITTQISNIKELIEDVRNLDRSNSVPLSANSFPTSACSGSTGFNLPVIAFDVLEQSPVTSCQTIEEDNSICTLSIQNDGSDHTISFSELNQHGSENNNLEGMQNNNSTQSNVTIRSINVVLTQTARIIQIFFPELCFRF